jgi:hypothetical protein
MSSGTEEVGNQIRQRHLPVVAASGISHYYDRLSEFTSFSSAAAAAVQQ